MTALLEGISAVAASLREFGYPDATDEVVRKHFDDWKAGRASSGDIVAMMAVGQFEDYPEIFGKPESVE